MAVMRRVAMTCGALPVAVFPDVGFVEPPCGGAQSGLGCEPPVQVNGHRRLARFDMGALVDPVEEVDESLLCLRLVPNPPLRARRR